MGDLLCTFKKESTVEVQLADSNKRPGRVRHCEKN